MIRLFRFANPDMKYNLLMNVCYLLYYSSLRYHHRVATFNRLRVTYNIILKSVYIHYTRLGAPLWESSSRMHVCHDVKTLHELRRAVCHVP